MVGPVYEVEISLIVTSGVPVSTTGVTVLNGGLVDKGVWDPRHSVSRFH